MKAICDNCVKGFSKSRSLVEKSNHNFCCVSCYATFRKNKMEYKIVRKKDFSAFNKIRELSRRNNSDEEKQWKTKKGE